MLGRHLKSSLLQSYYVSLPSMDLYVVQLHNDLDESVCQTFKEAGWAMEASKGVDGF